MATRTARKRPGKTDSPSWPAAIDGLDAHLVELERSDHTRANYREDLEAFAEWYESKYQDPPILAALAPAELREWKAHLRDARRMEPATVNRKLAAIAALLRWAEERGHAPEIRRPRAIRTVRQPPKWLDKAQQRALLRGAEQRGKMRDELLVKILLHTGLRIAEAIALRWADVTVKERSGSLTVRKGKGRKQRTIPLNLEARAAFTELRTMRPPLEHCFIGPRRALSVRAAQDAIAKIARTARLPDLTAHALRHTFGKNLADSGAGIQLIADLMGHESLETTRLYIQPGHDDLAAAVEKLAGGED